MASGHYVTHTFKLSLDLSRRLSEYKRRTGVTKTFLFERAIRDYLDLVERALDAEGEGRGEPTGK